MPPGVYPVPKFRTTASRSVRTRASLALRLRTRWRRNRLDEKLAHGADPGTSAELRLRAAQLRSSAERARLANALVEALGEARGPNLGAFTANARQRDDSIREYADDLLALVLRLRDDLTVDVRGAAMAALLVNDHASPLHHNRGQDLKHELRAARLALDPTSSTTQELATAA